MKVSAKLYAPAALPAVKNTGNHWLGGWVSPAAGLGSTGAHKIFCPCQDNALQHWQWNILRHKPQETCLLTPRLAETVANLQGS